MSKTKVAMLGPCLGVGGADALMLGLVKHCTNIEVTGIYCGRHSEVKHIEWAKKATALPPIHSWTQNPDQVLDDIVYHDKPIEAIKEVVLNADIVWNWCNVIDQNIKGIWQGPVIEYAQNCDKYAQNCVTENLNLTSHHVACSETAGRVYKDLPHSIIYNGIDPSRVAPGLGREKQRKVWGLEDKKILLYMGRLVPEKHPEMAVTCLPHLDDSWVTVFVGEGHRDVELYRLAQSICPDRVFFVNPVYQIGDVLAAADLFFLPSDFEGHSLSLLEAWLAGTPTLCTDFDAVKEMELKHGALTGMLPRVADPRAVADAVIETTTETDLNFTRVANARSVTWDNYTLPTIAAQWEEFFDRCLFDWRKRRRLNEINLVKPLEPAITA